MTFGTKDYFFGLAAHAVWVIFVYIVVIKNCFARASRIKKIDKIAVTNCRLIEVDKMGREIRSVNFLGKKVVFRKRTKNSFDLEMKGNDFLNSLFDSPFFKAIDFGKKPHLYIACNIDISSKYLYDNILKLGSE